MGFPFWFYGEFLEFPSKNVNEMKLLFTTVKSIEAKS